MPSSTLPIQPSPSPQTPETTLHLLPTKLTRAAPANAAKYWHPKPASNPSSDPSLPTSDSASDSPPPALREQPPQPEPQQHETPTPTYTSLFRGRNLLGAKLPVPAGYTGYILAAAANPTPAAFTGDDEGEGDGVGSYPEKVLLPLASFDTMYIWGHDELPAGGGARRVEGGGGGGGGATEAGGAGAGDVVIRGVEEWVGWAEKIHGFDEDDDE